MFMDYEPTLYDSDPRTFLKDEVDFYKKLVATLAPKTILELGVGTGRIFAKLLPTVDFAVGIDSSEAMLAACERKCSGSGKYALTLGSFVEFDLARHFDLIYMPFNTFQHLLRRNDQLKCLASVKKHLAQEGSFILDVMNGDNVGASGYEWKTDYSVRLPDGSMIEREQRTVDSDANTFVVHKIFRYNEYKQGNRTRVREFDALMKISPNLHIVDLLREAGFRIKEIWSDYFLKTTPDSDKRIYWLEADGL